MDKNSNTKELPTAEGYDRWAPIYEHNENPLMALDEMAFMENIQPVVKGERILDLGCGTGRYTIWLSEKGAEVTGVDGSEGMLKIARASCGSTFALNPDSNIVGAKVDLIWALVGAAASSRDIRTGSNNQRFANTTRFRTPSSGATY